MVNKRSGSFCMALYITEQYITSFKRITFNPHIFAVAIGTVLIEYSPATFHRIQFYNDKGDTSDRQSRDRGLHPITAMSHSLLHKY